MTKENKAPSPFSEKNPKLQLAWDSTSLGLLKRCPRLYKRKMIDGWVSKRRKPALEFGILYHSCMEFYEKLKVTDPKASHEDLLRETLRYLMKEAGERIPHEGVNEDLQLDETNSRFVPWQSMNKLRTRENLARAVIWKLEHYKDDPLETHILPSGKPAVELSFRFNAMKSNEGEDFMLCGHIDKLVNYNGAIWILDHKTSSKALNENFFNSFSPDSQMTLYILGAHIATEQKISGAIIDGCYLGQLFNRFSRGFAMRSDAQLEEFMTDLKYWLSLAEYFSQQNYWPMNELSCDKWGSCGHREICSKNKEMRPSFLKADFQIDHWNPLETR